MSLPALIVLAPCAALLRTLSRWRRGTDPRVEWRRDATGVVGDRAMVRFQAAVDLPLAVEGSRKLTEFVARLAECLETGEAVYHLIHDEPGGDGQVAVPLGPSIQGLAERFYSLARRSAMEGMAVTWLCLPPDRALGEALERSNGFGDAAARLLQIPLLWGMVVRRRSGSASVRFLLDLVVPDGSTDDVERALNTLRAPSEDR